MERNKEQEQKCQGGAATVEAIVSFSCFLFVVFTILTTVKYCRAQALISNAVDSAVKELSQYSYYLAQLFMEPLRFPAEILYPVK